MDSRHIDECEKIKKTNENRWKKSENEERIRKLEDQSKLAKEYRLSRASILKENFLKKHVKKEGKTNVKWSKEKLDTRKKNWKMYREVILKKLNVLNLFRN